MIGARKTLTGIRLGFDSCSEWMSVTVGREKWTFKSTLGPLSAAAHRRLSNSEPCAMRRFWTCKSIPVSASWQCVRAEPGAAGGTTIGAARYMGKQSKERTYDGAA